VYFDRHIAYGNGMYHYGLIGNCQISALIGLSGSNHLRYDIRSESLRLLTTMP
jgi:hypothetical protein